MADRLTVNIFIRFEGPPKIRKNFVAEQHLHGTRIRCSLRFSPHKLFYLQSSTSISVFQFLAPGVHLLFQHQRTFCSKKWKQLPLPYLYFLNHTFPPLLLQELPHSIPRLCELISAFSRRGSCSITAGTAFPSSKELLHGLHQP